VKLISLGNNQEIKTALDRVRSGLRVVGNRYRADELALAGELLLGPIGEDLPETVYLMAAGSLAGFPFEALLHEGRYFGEDHQLIHILSLDVLHQAAPALGDAGNWQRIWMAGDPWSGRSDTPQLPSVSSELDGMAHLFEGRVVSRRSGAQLSPELFRDTEFASANLVHLASHAQINLEYPELSRLLLSSVGGTAVYVTPLDLGRASLSADLVVLSACETTGVNRFSFDSNLGFVPAFLNSGARAVVATLWPVSDAFAAEFVLQFYAAMLAGANAPMALRQVKRRYIADPEAGANLDWLAFQIYIN
jgi:CHAT domain-containing protein